VPVSEPGGVHVSGDFAAVARTNAVIDIFDGELTASAKPRLTIQSYSDSIRCCCASDVFVVAVIGTMNGSLILSSLRKGSTVKVIDLEGALPRLATVTSGWGLIAAYAQRARDGKAEELIFVFNVNGDAIGRVEIDTPVT